MTAFEEVKRNYVDTGKVRYVSRYLPLAMHPSAMSAAEQDKGKFCEMRHRLIVNANELGLDRYNALADELKLDRSALPEVSGRGKVQGRGRTGCVGCAGGRRQRHTDLRHRSRRR